MSSPDYLYLEVGVEAYIEVDELTP